MCGGECVCSILWLAQFQWYSMRMYVVKTVEWAWAWACCCACIQKILISVRTLDKVCLDTQCSHCDKIMRAEFVGTSEEFQRRQYDLIKYIILLKSNSLNAGHTHIRTYEPPEKWGEMELFVHIPKVVGIMRIMVAHIWIAACEWDWSQVWCLVLILLAMLSSYHTQSWNRPKRENWIDKYTQILLIQNAMGRKKVATNWRHFAMQSITI